MPSLLMKFLRVDLFDLLAERFQTSLCLYFMWEMKCFIYLFSPLLFHVASLHLPTTACRVSLLSPLSSPSPLMLSTFTHNFFTALHERGESKTFL